MDYYEIMLAKLSSELHMQCYDICNACKAWEKSVNCTELRSIICLNHILVLSFRKKFLRHDDLGPIRGKRTIFILTVFITFQADSYQHILQMRLLHLPKGKSYSYFLFAKEKF